MRVKIIARNKEAEESLIKRAKERGFCEIVEDKPEIIITFGGDGTFLFAERKYPGIPKLILRHKSICNKCHHGALEEILKSLDEHKYEILEYQKLEAVVKKKLNIIKRVAANDIVISNRLPYRALRFKIKTENFEKVFIGDGIITATAFGSTGYFHSITRKDFKEKFGIAFNNTLEKQEPIFFNNEKIVLEVLRNDAYVSFDNDDRMIIIREGDSVEIKKSEKKFRIVKADIPEGEI